MRSFLFIFVAGLSLWYATAECPPASVIWPCICDDGLIPDVECGNITDMETLLDVFNRSGDRKFKAFVLFNSTVMYLPAAAVATKGFDMLMILNVHMSALFDNLPHDDNNIIIIHLQNVTFQRGVGWELFRPLKKLGLFKAENTEIISLGKSFTDNINRNLTTLSLKNTKTKNIQHDAFSQLTNLQYLEIVNSKIKSIQRSMFANPSVLQDIYFSGNQIETLPDDIFSNMPVLKDVHLENNKLTTVSQAVFGILYDRPGWIYLSGNPLICDCKIKWFVFKETERVSGHCARPEDKKGKNIPDMNKKDLDYC